MCAVISIGPMRCDLRGGRIAGGGGGGGGGSQVRQTCGGSLARQLAVKAGQADGKGLKSTHGIVIVQGEDVFCHSAKLHDDVISWKGRGVNRDISVCVKLMKA